MPLFFSIVLLSLLSLSFSLSPPCPHGHVPTDSTCTPCPPGTFHHSASSRTCTPCPAGTYSPYSGALGLDICKFCPPKTFNPLPRATSRSACKPCPSSIYSGAATCLQCPKDFRPGVLARKCEPCSRLSFTTGFGVNKCITCEDRLNMRKVGKLGKGTCEKCPLGTGAEYNTCRICDGERSEYNDGTFSGCRGCPAGQRGFPLKGGATRCVGCPEGTARDTWVAGAMCYNCPKGQNAAIVGGIICVPNGIECPNNFNTAVGGACLRCGKSERWDVKRRACVKCGDGEESNGGIDVACRKCAKGAVSGENGCVCPPGSERVAFGCRKCAEGKVNARYEQVCRKCPSGTYSKGAGGVECVACGREEAQPREGQGSCVKCPKGMVGGRMPGSEESRCVVGRTNCPIGYERMNGPGGWLLNCKSYACPLGSFEIKKKVGGVFCERCTTGERYDKKIGKCVECADDEISAGGVARQCWKCGGGRVRVDGRCVCRSGERDGSGRGIVGGKCRLCPRGSIGRPWGTVCEKCPAGSYQPKLGQMSCRPCLIGWFSPRPGSVKCKKCAKGETSILQYHEGSAREYYTRTQGVGSANCVKL